MVVRVIIMTRQNKIYMATALTVLAAFATVLCLFAMDGFSLRTAVAIGGSYFFAQLTVSFFKVENILRAKRAREKRQQLRRSKLAVVKGGKANRVAA